MGTRVAPSYANIFMGHFEDRFVYKRTVRPWIWWRYIDDIFAVWTRSEEELKSFIQDLNQAHRTIKFTVETSKTTINFLDVKVNISEGDITTDLYTKPTDKHQYLLRNSAHPKHCKLGIPYGQFLRIRRICSNTSRYREKASEFRHHFQKRGYEETLLDAAITRAQERSREDTLQKRTPTTPQDRTVLVTTYSPHLPPLHTTIKKYWNLLQLSSRTKDIFKDPPLVAYRRNKNIKDMLVRARIPKENRNFLEKFVPSGSFPCGKNRCTNCAYVKKANNFKSHRTGKCYAIRTHINCQSKNIVYLIQCKKCGVQYVGETKQTLANRLNGHRSAINTKKDTPVSAHFNQTHHSVGDLEILGIERLRYTGNEDLTRQRRLQRESYWIHQLRTLHPDGLNQESLEITRV
ncbi:corticospinal neuron axon guidance through spinal cord [Branchiostoma belcheri]|nr:corticospinal neuron axon guidance through spinal cord [Branchiostoma belcheri]